MSAVCCCRLLSAVTCILSAFCLLSVACCLLPAYSLLLDVSSLLPSVCFLSAVCSVIWELEWEREKFSAEFHNLSEWHCEWHWEWHCDRATSWDASASKNHFIDINGWHLYNLIQKLPWDRVTFSIEKQRCVKITNGRLATSSSDNETLYNWFPQRSTINMVVIYKQYQINNMIAHYIYYLFIILKMKMKNNIEQWRKVMEGLYCSDQSQFALPLMKTKPERFR